jgi:hypothetical protein
MGSWWAHVTGRMGFRLWIGGAVGMVMGLMVFLG